MMTSLNGNIFRVTGHLCREFTGHTKTSDAEPWFFFDMRLNNRLGKQSWSWWFGTPLRPLWCNCNDHTNPTTLSIVIPTQYATDIYLANFGCLCKHLLGKYGVSYKFLINIVSYTFHPSKIHLLHKMKWSSVARGHDYLDGMDRSHITHLRPCTALFRWRYSVLRESLHWCNMQMFLIK